MKITRFVLMLSIFVSIFGLTPTTARAASTITVVHLNDDTINGNGCSLREAITNANNDALTFPDCLAGSGSDTITFSASLNGSILLASALPVLSDTDGLSISGGTAKVAINGVSTFRIFDIPAGVSVTIQNLTLANGNGDGGNIYNAGTLSLQSSTLTGGTGTNGGAIHNTGTASVTNSTFTLNTADFGAVLYNNLGTVTITNSTINDNTISGGGTGILFNNGILTIKNTIVTDGNGAALCAGNALNFASTNNYSEVDLSCGPGFSAVLPGDLALGPFANNGGSTWTFALLPASVAINAGTNSACPAVDQRGTGRPQGTTCDVGSFESKISLTFSPTSLSFGNSVVGATSLPKTVTITNTGEANIIIGVITITTLIPGEFNIVNDLCSGMTIAPTSTCTFDVTFAPTTNVAKTGTVFIPSNILASPSTVALTGTGIFGTNMILNPGFEYPYKQPIGWRNPAPPYTLNSVVDKTTGYLSCCALKLPGKGRLVYVYQGVASAGKAGFRFAIRLSSKADNITVLNPGEVYMGQLIFQDRRNKPTEIVTMTFTPGTHDWEHILVLFVTTKDFYNFVFRISVNSPAGNAWFDNAAVIRLP